MRKVFKMKPYSELTLRQKKSLHKAIWNELSKTGAWEKHNTKTIQYLKQRGIELECNCVLCEEFRHISNTDDLSNCTECPLCATSYSPYKNHPPCMYSDNPYWYWTTAFSQNERKQYAKQIRDIWR